MTDCFISALSCLDNFTESFESDMIVLLFVVDVGLCNGQEKNVGDIFFWFWFLFFVLFLFLFFVLFLCFVLFFVLSICFWGYFYLFPPYFAAKVGFLKYATLRQILFILNTHLMCGASEAAFDVAAIEIGSLEYERWLMAKTCFSFLLFLHTCTCFRS